MFILSPLQSEKQNLPHNLKFNHTLNIYNLRANSYSEGLSIIALTAAVPSSSFLRPLEHPPWPFALPEGPNAHMWIHRFESSLPTFLIVSDFRSDNDSTVWPLHGMSEPLLSSHPSPMLPWQPEGLGGKLVLTVLCPSLCPAWCQPQAWAQWGNTDGVI